MAVIANCPAITPSDAGLLQLKSFGLYVDAILLSDEISAAEVIEIGANHFRVDGLIWVGDVQMDFWSCSTFTKIRASLRGAEDDASLGGC